MYWKKPLNADAPLEVSTYTSQDLEGVRYAAERFSGARLRLQTRIDINGDAQLVLPQEKGEVDPALWNYHMEMVRQAQASRLELLKTLVLRPAGRLTACMKSRKITGAALRQPGTVLSSQGRPPGRTGIPGRHEIGGWTRSAATSLHHLGATAAISSAHGNIRFL